ncbi:uncharacterized protein LOC122971195 [Scomber scombrus]|uniref:Uncharacterized protein LOC122971195 n=1 Tax=Scomber scombrus TaxID=13677 RepID=A0AAV1NRX9_SCOSC
MTCVEKRHMSHRMGSMLHHRFPNGFTDLFMDETDREVSTLTDRAFRSLCIGDDAVYNDEFLYGYSPFSCHKPLAGEPLKKTHHKESKKQGQNKNDRKVMPGHGQQKNISNMSSFLKALSATEENCEGMLKIKNGGMTDSNGESWDKSALRSIQRELSDFSSDYHNNLTDGYHKNHHRRNTGDGSSNKTGKDALLSGKSSKIKNGKSTVKLRKLNIKNFFLHSEFSPFQTWRDFNQFPFGQEDTVTSILPTDNIPKWYDLPFYKELREAHRKETLHTEETQSCQTAAVELPPPTAPKPIPPPSPPKVLPKPSASRNEKRCSSDRGDGSTAPWRRNRSRANSTVSVNQPGIPSQDNCSTTVNESPLLLKKEARSVEVKAVEEVSSLASTPFSICQLMTPLIPSRQPTETSEILQAVLSPSALDLPLRPHSEAKLTPEPPVKRDSYKSLASSILFNLKDNRKRVKSRYSPPKFKTLEVPEGGSQSPQSDHLKHPLGSDGNASGLSTPAISKDGQIVCSPLLQSPTVGLTKHNIDQPQSDDYLLSNLLQTKREGSLGEENPVSSFIHSKKNKSPITKKQNYPSLNLYKKTSPVDTDMKYLQVPQSSSVPVHIDQPIETNRLSLLMQNKEISLKSLPTNIGLSPNTLNVNKDNTPIISPHALEKEGLSSNISVGKRPPNVPDKAKQPVKDIKEKDSGTQPISSKERDTSGQSMRTIEVIRAAREAINATKNKALFVAQPESINKPISDIEELNEKETDEKIANSEEMVSSRRESSVAENSDILSQSGSEGSDATLTGKNGNVKREPPPVPKRNFTKSDIQLPLDKQHTYNIEKLTNGDLGEAKLDLPAKVSESVQKRGNLKHIFAARQNNYIKCQRYAVTDDQQGEKYKEGDPKVNTGAEKDEETISLKEMRDSENIINDLHALKELERARLGDRIHENAKNKLGVTNIDEEARAKNDLISRELRNIKKGMLSMRGNTSAKRELFAKKEKEQNKSEAFSKIDSNVIVNKAVINDNYDRAKFALEEIITERQIRRNKMTEHDANPIFEENAGVESYVPKVQQCKKAMTDSLTESKEKEKDLKERLGDLRDHNHMRQILSQTEPRLGESHRSGGRVALPGMDKVDNETDTLLNNKAKYVTDKLTDNPCYVADNSEVVNLTHMVRQVSENTREDLFNENEGNKLDAPPVPPRSKKGANRRNDTISKETDSLEDVVVENTFDNDKIPEKGEPHLVKEIRSTGSGKKDVDSDWFIKEVLPSPSETSSNEQMCDVVNNANLKSITSTEFRGNEYKTNNLQTDMSPTMESIFVNNNVKAQETCKVKRKAPLKPDNLTMPDEYVTKSLVADEEPDKIYTASEEVNVDAEALSEIPRNIISPLLLVNGVSVTQSPPDQASLSSKSSYFSVESALHRNTETENSIGEAEELDEFGENVSTRKSKQKSDRAELDYYSLSDHESEPELVKQPIKNPQKESGCMYKEGKERENTIAGQSLSNDDNNQTPVSPYNVFSPTLGVPALFNVKDNTFSNKLKKTGQPWSPRGSLSGSERGEEEKPEIPLANGTVTSDNTSMADEIFKPKEILSNHSTPLLLSPSNLQSDNPKKPQVGGFLEVPQEEGRASGLSPSSEGVESLTASTADAAEDMGVNADKPADREVSKVPSEHSGSTCSGNESQTGLPKPPTVLPKSEKAVLKAIKLTNRRMKKEEAHKSSQKSSQSSSKHKSDRHKSEAKSSSSRNGKSSEKKQSEKMEDGHHLNESHHGKTSNDRSEPVAYERRGHDSEHQHHHRTEMRHRSRRQSHDSIKSNNQNNEPLPTISNDRSEPVACERRGHESEHQHHHRTEMRHRSRRQSHDSVKSNNHNNEPLPTVAAERQGRRNDRHIRDKPEQRHYSSDRVISNVPVYKAHVSDRPMSDRPFNRSQSIDRYLGDKVERRLSADMSVNEKLDSRSQRIEKSIMDELQQRGRARDKASRDNPLRRSHSIDTYSSDASHPSILSRQSSHTSHTSQLSRQSSIEHTIVTQSIPMTQRKLLQDPDSGQFFFVDMPVQVKTKTFFDPETGNYVQLPVQPPEGAVLKPSPMEVLTPPLVVYHSFVPVPLSPMAQNASVKAPHVEPEEFELRHLDRSKQMHCKDGNPYLEPVFSQHDHTFGDFLGTEELDCPS